MTPRLRHFINAKAMTDIKVMRRRISELNQSIEISQRILAETASLLSLVERMAPTTTPSPEGFGTIRRNPSARPIPNKPEIP